MHCSTCGKEISDDSKFCYNCGLKIDFIKSSENIETDSISPIEIDTSTKHQDAEEKIPITNNIQTVSNPPLKTKRSWGWLVLFAYYALSMSSFDKKNQFSGGDYYLIISLLGLIAILPIYFWFRKYLIKKNFWKGHIASSSLMAGVISYILVVFLVVGSIILIGNYEKKKEAKEFSNSFIKQSQEYQKKELEYTKMMESEPKTESELKDKILKIDEYKIFIIKKHNVLFSMVNYFRETNAKHKKDKSIDEQITKLEKVFRDGLQTSTNSIDMYKKYLITGDEKYYNSYKQGYDKLQLGKNEVTQLITNIAKSL